MFKQSNKIDNFILAKDTFTRDKLIELGCHFINEQDGAFLMTNEVDSEKLKSLKFDNNMKFACTNRITF